MADVPFIDLDPYLLAVQATLLALQQAGLIPDLNPLDYIISEFDGRPKLEDTELAALRLQVSPWWPLRALGNNLQIWVRNGVPLSTGIAADRLELSQWIQGTIDSLEPIVFNRLDPYSLDHAIWLAMTSQYGDQAIQQLNNEIGIQHAKGPLPALPTQPPGPPPTPTEVGWHISRDGDELSDLGDTVIFQNSQIYDILNQIAKEIPGGSEKCCASIVAAIGLVDTELKAIVTAIEAEATADKGGGVNAQCCADVVAAVGTVSSAIEDVSAAVRAVSGQNPSELQNLTAAVQNLNATVDKLAQCVCDALAQAAGVGADMQAKFAALIQRDVDAGFIDATDAQILLS